MAQTIMAQLRLTAVTLRQTGKVLQIPAVQFINTDRPCNQSGPVCLDGTTHLQPITLM